MVGATRRSIPTADEPARDETPSLLAWQRWPPAPSGAGPAPTRPPLYQQHCAACHGPGRLGLTGPALLPESLARLRKPEAIKVIREGRAGDADAGLCRPPERPRDRHWPTTSTPPCRRRRLERGRHPRLAHRAFAPGSLPATSPPWLFKGDMMNLFIVVETGDHHVTCSTATSWSPSTAFPSRYALHGGPKFTPDGRYVFFASRDGWITKFDIWNLKVVAEIRAGINTRNVAVSGDGKYLAVANYLPHTLVLLDADLNLLKIIRCGTRTARKSSRVSAVYDAAPRQSFVAALKDVPEVGDQLQPQGRRHPGRHDPRLQVQGRQLHSRLPQSAPQPFPNRSTTSSSPRIIPS
jgi:hypothetical protein